jgi:hypothetical protein
MNIGTRPFGIRPYPRECHRGKSVEKYLISIVKPDPKNSPLPSGKNSLSPFLFFTYLKKVACPLFFL